MIRAVLALLLLGAASASAQQVAPETQGRADRIAFEQWIKGLGPDQRRGADFWADQRNKPSPVSCLGTDQAARPGFVEGCQEAQRRLALPDVRRKTEPGYRLGWNASLGQSFGSAQPTGEVTWYVLAPVEHTCLLVEDVFHVRTPEQVVAELQRSGVTYLPRRSDNGSVTLFNVADRDNNIVLFRDKSFCEGMAKLNFSR